MKFFQQYLEEKFSKKFYRVPVDLNLNCPFGNDIEQRCFFCDEDGSRPAHLKKNMPLLEQVKTGAQFVRKNYGNECGLIAYVQTHTGTNATVNQLRKIFQDLLSMEKFECLIIATRPDSLDKDKISLLAELNKEIELWVELGVQTANDSTLKLINRKHDFSAVKNSVTRLQSKGVNVAAHVILGLPGEGLCDFRKTAKKISSLPFSAVKIHNLLILKNTVFEKWYYDGRIKTMNEYEYAAILLDFIRELRQDLLLMRVSADAEPSKLVAPKWKMTKHQFLEMIKSMLNFGSKNKYSKTLTADGSWTLWHPSYKEYYRSIYGAKTESRKIFIEPCEIRKKIIEKKEISILEIGLGLGLNLSESLVLLDNHDCHNAKFEYIALEKDLSCLENSLILDILPKTKQNIFKTLIETKAYTDDKIHISVIEDDARNSIKKILKKFDAVYLDPFSPDKNPEMWTYDFLKLVTGKMKPDGILATYSSAYPLRGALIRCGLNIADIRVDGRKRAGTLASFAKNFVYETLPSKELDIIQKTTAAVPYRDAELNSSPEAIRARRAKLISRLRKKGVPKWLR